MQAQFIGDHGDELAVGGLAPGVVDGIAEVGVQHVHVAPVPSHFNGMADGAFHPGTGGVILFGHIGVKLFGHSVDDFRVLHCHQDGVSQVVIAFNVGRHANLVEDLCNLHPQAGADRFRIEMPPLHGEKGKHTLGHFVFVIGGQGEIGNASGSDFPLNDGVGIRGGHYVEGVFHIGVLGHRVDYPEGV